MIDLETISLEIRKFTTALCLIDDSQPILYDPRFACSCCQHLDRCNDQLDRAAFLAVKSIGVDYLAGIKTRDEAIEAVRGILDYLVD